MSDVWTQIERLEDENEKLKAENKRLREGLKQIRHILIAVHALNLHEATSNRD